LSAFGVFIISPYAWRFLWTRSCLRAKISAEVIRYGSF
jgi:hypothetical protein